MKNRKTLLAVGLVAALGGAAYANEDTQVKTTISAENNVANVDSSQIAEVDYAKNSSVLTADEKKEIDKAVSAAKEKGEIDQARILAWADKEYPKEGMKAPKHDRDLAAKRSRSVADYLKTKHDIKTETYNMAERPTSMEKLFSTKDYEVKTTAENTGKAPTNKDLNLLKTNGRASTALVLVQLKR